MSKHTLGGSSGFTTSGLTLISFSSSSSIVGFLVVVVGLAEVVWVTIGLLVVVVVVGIGSPSAGSTGVDGGFAHSG